MAVDEERIKSIASWGYFGEVVVEGTNQIIEGPLKVILGGSMLSNKIIAKQGEAKTLKLTIQSLYGAIVDVSLATVSLFVKKTKEKDIYTFSKTDTDFDKSEGEDGILYVDLSETDTDQLEGEYIGELKLEWAGPTVSKSCDIYIKIVKSVET